MPIEKKPVRTTRPSPASFRLSEESIRQLKVLATVLNRTQTEIIEAMLSDEFDRCKKKYPREVVKADKEL